MSSTREIGRTRYQYLNSNPRNHIIFTTMVEWHKDKPVTPSPEEIKKEMIEYLTDPESGKVRQLAFFDVYDRQRIERNRTDAIWELKKNPDEDSKLFYEFDIRVIEIELALLNHQIAINNRIPGYKKSFEKAIKFTEDVNQIVYDEFRVQHDGADFNVKIGGDFDTTYRSHLEDVYNKITEKHGSHKIY